MKPSQIFDLVVRLSGYFALFTAGNLLLQMVLMGVNFGFRPILWIAAVGFVGIVLMKVAPIVTEFAYGRDDS